MRLYGEGLAGGGEGGDMSMVYFSGFFDFVRWMVVYADFYPRGTVLRLDAVVLRQGLIIEF